jgi:carbon-monoxide dehydrogenase medium subunit
MKSPPFEYVKVHQVEEALALLQTHRDDARILAGGQTLLATLNMRLSEPALLIDISGIDALRGIERVGNWLRIGAMTTHSEIESSALVVQHAPLLSAAVPHIAHRAIRNSGTWGGSIAYGDPAAEWPCCLVAMEGVITVQGPAGQRRIAATDFFLDL